jgi:hypothetical protein
MDDNYLGTGNTTSLERVTNTHVTVTHPYHPLNGQKVEIVSVPRNPTLKILVQTEDDNIIGIPREWTDYERFPDDEMQEPPSHLCSVEALRQLIGMLTAGGSGMTTNAKDRR